MSGNCSHDCEHCGEELHIFGESHIDEIAGEYNIDTVAKLPIEPKLASACDHGEIESFARNWLEHVFQKIKQNPDRK